MQCTTLNHTHVHIPLLRSFIQKIRPGLKIIDPFHNGLGGLTANTINAQILDQIQALILDWPLNCAEGELGKPNLVKAG
jgi:hypothetical protein